MVRTASSLILLLFAALILTTACGGAAGGEGELLFAETFTLGETAAWELERDALGRTSVQDGQLIVEVNGPNLMQFATLPGQTFADFALDVEARQLSGALDNSYGVLLRMQNYTQFYRFEITGNGTYMIERRNADGSWVRYVNSWTSHGAINQGLNVTNALRIEAEGTILRFYVNSVLVQEINDAAYSSGTIALDAGTFVQGDTKVAFDNLMVHAP
jgi:hypothetical protein